MTLPVQNETVWNENVFQVVSVVQRNGEKIDRNASVFVIDL